MAGRRDQFLTGAVERSQEDEAEVVGGGALEEDEAEVVGARPRWSAEEPVGRWLEKRPEEEHEAGRGRKI